MTQYIVLVFMKQKLIFSRCRSIIAGPWCTLILYSDLACFLKKQNLLGYCVGVVTPVSVFFTLSVSSSIFFTNQKSFLTVSQLILLFYKYSVGLAFPLHYLLILCLFTQARLHDFTSHPGHVYLDNDFTQTSQRLLRPAFVVLINSLELLSQFCSSYQNYPYYSSASDISIGEYYSIIYNIKSKIHLKIPSKFFIPNNIEQFVIFGEIVKIIKNQKFTQQFLNMMNKIWRASISQVKKQFMKITPNAEKRILTLIGKKNDPSIIGIKIGLTKKGCNGLTYSMNYVKQAGKFDEVVQRNNYKLIIDSKALMALVGTQMDYVQNQLGSEFLFVNPNEKGRCGCGESFHI